MLNVGSHKACLVFRNAYKLARFHHTSRAVFCHIKRISINIVSSAGGRVVSYRHVKQPVLLFVCHLFGRGRPDFSLSGGRSPLLAVASAGLEYRGRKVLSFET